jgi:hypothetical protein
MLITPDKKKILVGLIHNLTPGHISTLVASLREPYSQIGTSTNSENYAFLQQLSEWGLAREIPLEVDFPPEIQAVLKSFLINEDAKAEIAKLLRQCLE